MAAVKSRENAPSFPGSLSFAFLVVWQGRQIGESLGMWLILSQNFVFLHTLGVATSLILLASAVLRRSLKMNKRGRRQTISTLTGLIISRGLFFP